MCVCVCVCVYVCLCACVRARFVHPPKFGGNSELRELAGSLQRDIWTSNPDVRWSDVAAGACVRARARLCACACVFVCVRVCICVMLLQLITPSAC